MEGFPQCSTCGDAGVVLVRQPGDRLTCAPCHLRWLGGPFDRDLHPGVRSQMDPTMTEDQKRQQFEDEIRAVQCQKCGAKPEEPCHTMIRGVAGDPVTYFHLQRIALRNALHRPGA